MGHLRHRIHNSILLHIDGRLRVKSKLIWPNLLGADCSVPTVPPHTEFSSARAS